jgi:hypothetical protein
MSSVNPLYDIINSVNVSVQQKIGKSGDTLTGPLVLGNQNQIQFNESLINGTNYVSLKAPANLPATLNFILPGTIGTANYVLTNVDGKGTLGWSAGGGSSFDQSLNTTDAPTFTGLTVNQLAVTSAKGGTMNVTASSALNISAGTTMALSVPQISFGGVLACDNGLSHLTISGAVQYTPSTITVSNNFAIDTMLTNLVYINASAGVITLSIGTTSADGTIVTVAMTNAAHAATLPNTNVIVTTQIQWSVLGDNATLLYVAGSSKWIVISVSRAAMVS